MKKILFGVGLLLMLISLSSPNINAMAATSQSVSAPEGSRPPTMVGGSGPSCIWILIMPGFEDSNCFAVTSAVCAVVGGALPLRAACIAAAAVACYVPPVYACQYYSG